MRLPTYFLSHGGGPWPYMDGAFRSHYAWLEQALMDIPSQLPAPPRAALVVSGHWEASQFTLSAAARPGMVYDYEGFPPYTYDVIYPAPGEPVLAKKVQALLQALGIPVHLDESRGYDHGTFSVLQPMYPEASLPVVQLSLKSSLDAHEHLAIGRALAPLRDEGILLVGSGMSYHNLRQLNERGAAPSAEFDHWLRHVLLDLDGAERWRALADWAEAPAARLAHPRADHLMPLMVVAGAAADEPASCVFGQHMYGRIRVSSFRFSVEPSPSRFDLLGRSDAGATRPFRESSSSS